MALACGPKLLFADEPTTALDVTVQAQVLDLLAEQQRDRYMAMILVTHDLGVVAGRAHEIAVMYAGSIVERAPTTTLFANMKMPYTEALLAAIPKLADPPPPRLAAIGGRPPTSSTLPLVARSHRDAPMAAALAATSVRAEPVAGDPRTSSRATTRWIQPRPSRSRSAWRWMQ
ncbi:MAG: hypothetical protein M5U19_11225 [Microthrixaceae bacterium]|nr:hypothetical protein [Microthrixaceae bacterium]